MKFPQGKIKRVFLEFEDGTAELTDEEAKKWLEAVQAEGALAYIHGMPFPDLNWVVRPKEASDAVSMP